LFLFQDIPRIGVKIQISTLRSYLTVPMYELTERVQH